MNIVSAALAVVTVQPKNCSSTAIDNKNDNREFTAIDDSNEF